MTDLKFLSMGELLAGSAIKHPWPVADLIPYAGVTLIYGQCADGMAIPLARAIATGEPWNGKPTFREGGKVCLFTQCDAHTAAAELGEANHIMLAAKQTIWGDQKLKNDDVVKFEERAVGTINSATDAGAEILVLEYPAMRNLLDVRRLVKGWNKAADETGVPVVLCVPTPMIDTTINYNCAATIHVSRIFVPGRWGARCTWITGQRDAADQYAIYTDGKGAVIADSDIAQHMRDKCEVLACASLKWIADGNNAKKLMTQHDMDQNPDLKFLIQDVLPDTGVGFIYGDPKTGKSFITLSMALHIAADVPWFGHEIITPGAVVYIAAEGAGGFKKRLRAARKQYGLSKDTPFHVMPRAVQLMDKDAVLQFIRNVAEEAGMPVLVIVDTLSRSMTGSDENSAKEMSVAIEAAEDIKRAFGCLVLVVHHTGKDGSRGMRGSFAATGAADYVGKVTRTSLADRKAGKDDVVTLANDVMKEGEEGAELFFDMVLMDIGEAKPGIALRQRDTAPVTQDTGPKLTGGQKRAEEIVLAAFREADTDDMPMAGAAEQAAGDANVTTAGRAVDRRNNAKATIRKAGQNGGRFWVSGEDGAERLTLFNPEEGAAKPEDDTIPD